MIYPPNRALWITTGLLLCLLVAILTAMLMAARDGIEPPTGEALRDVLRGMHTVPANGVEAQVVRW